MMVREKHLCRGNRASEKAEPCRRVLEMTGQTVLLGCIQGMGSGAGAEQQEYTTAGVLLQRPAFTLGNWAQQKGTRTRTWPPLPNPSFLSG